MPILQDVNIKDKNEFNKLATHPLQSWVWGEFRKKTGLEVVRLGRYDKNKLIETAQITIHPIPFTNSTIGYLPKGGIPSREILQKLVEQYQHLFGQASVEVCKDAIKNMQVSPDSLPALLR